MNTACIIAMVSILAAQGDPLSVSKDVQNIVASRLEGEWEFDKELAQRLGAKGDFLSLSFASDPAVLQRIPAKNAQRLKGEKIYMAGHMTRFKKPFIFVLLSHRGNPYMVYYTQGKDADELNAEGAILLLVPGNSSDRDLLFLGGESFPRPFLAFRRKKQE